MFERFFNLVPKKSLKLFYKSVGTENRLLKPDLEQKFSVSSMTSAEEGQPPSNDPEEWQDTHTAQCTCNSAAVQ